MLYARLAIVIFLSGFPTKTLYSFPFSSIRFTFPARFNHYDFLTYIIFGEEYKS